MNLKSALLRVVPVGPIVTLLALAFGTNNVNATDGTWNVDASGNWGTAGNWTGGIPNGVGATANLTYTGWSKNRTITLDTSRTIGILNFATNSRSIHLASSAGTVLTLDNNGSPAQVNYQLSGTGNDFYIDAPVQLNGSLVTFSGVSSDSSKFVNFTNVNGGSITNVSNAPVTITNTGAFVQFNGVISDGANGSISVVENSPSSSPSAAFPLLLGAANTYSGSTTLTAGYLNLANASAIQNSTLVMSGGALVFDKAVISGAFTFGGLAAAFSGFGDDIILENNAASAAAVALTVGNNNTNTTYAGVLSDGFSSSGGSLTKVGTGTLTFTSTNTYTGPTTVSGGTLAVTGSLSGTNGVTVNTGGMLLLNSSTFASNIVGTGAVVPGTGQTFTGSVGTTTVTGGGGTLAVAGGQSGTTHSFASLALNAGSTLDFGSGGSNTNVNMVFGSLSLGGNTLTINNWNSTAYTLGQTVDSGTFGDGRNRLIFTSNPGFTLGAAIPGINFTGIGQGMEVSFGASSYAIVPVPEPGAAGLLATAALGLTSRRKRSWR